MKLRRWFRYGDIWGCPRNVKKKEEIRLRIDGLEYYDVLLISNF